MVVTRLAAVLRTLRKVCNERLLVPQVELHFLSPLTPFVEVLEHQLIKRDRSLCE